MSIELLESHFCFNGEQNKYSHYSEVLNCKMNFSLYIPSNEEGNKIPLIWWLSGLTCTDDNFAQKSGFQRLADKYKVAVVMPDTSPRGENIPDSEDWDLGTGAGFYLDATKEPWNKNYKMYTYITEELSNIVKEMIPNFSGKESIMGHSMGGHGALVIGMKSLDRFKSISAFAPIVSPSDVPWGIKAFNAYLGEDKSEWKEWDSTYLIKENSKTPILIHGGTKDNFYEEQLKEDKFMENDKNNLVTYKRVEGYDHSYFFISTFLEEHFDFHTKYLK